MATIDALKKALRRKATVHQVQQQPLSEAQYKAGFETLARGATAYPDFIVPQLTHLLVSLTNAHGRSFSVLEIGPGPQTVLATLPSHLRDRVDYFAAFEPNALFAANLEASLQESFPNLTSSPIIYHGPFTLDSGSVISHPDRKFDVVLFCHSMYGMTPKGDFIRRALNMLHRDGVVLVCHRDGLASHLDGLVCQHVALWPTGTISVPDWADGDEGDLDVFASLVAGFSVHDKHVLNEWRKMCRALGNQQQEEEEMGTMNLVFRSPEALFVLNQHAATALDDLAARGVPLTPCGEQRPIKNPEARLHRPAAIVRPTTIKHIQECVRWALHHHVSLTVVAGSHSGQCLWPTVVAVDMAAFQQSHIFEGKAEPEPESGSSLPVVVAEAGCQTGALIRHAATRGVTVPLGARPSVGAGLWLQGGIGHLARQHGLTCDAIIGAVMVSVATGDILCLGRVPREYQPHGAIVRPANEDDLLWALKGAGTNFGIVVSVTFQTCAAPLYTVQNWVLPLRDEEEARRRLFDFDTKVARLLPRHCSADAFLYWDAGHMQLGVTLYYHTDKVSSRPEPTCTPFQELEAATSSALGHGPRGEAKTIDGMGLFDTEMYMSELHGGHGSGKTSSFKRCVFLADIHDAGVANALIAAVQARPSSRCYLHMLHGGEAVATAAGADANAFGCRDWDFACVITGVWPRRRPSPPQHDNEDDEDEDEDDGLDAAVASSWVYDVVRALLALPQSRGVYGADLGPDPRDAMLAMQAFGRTTTNKSRLARLKRDADPEGVLAYACPLSESCGSDDLDTPSTTITTEKTPPSHPKLIILVTGASCAGKDYSARIWARVLAKEGPYTVRVVSISEATKRAYASATRGVDLDRLLHDDQDQNRAYKEQHRPALTAFYEAQLRQRPQLREEHFCDVVVETNGDVDVLLLTGLRDEAPVTTLGPLVPHSQLLDVCVRTGRRTRLSRGGRCDIDVNVDARNHIQPVEDVSYSSSSNDHGYQPSLVFNNDAPGPAAAETFAREQLLAKFLHRDLARLATMVRTVPDFPRAGISFRHVLGLTQHPGGLALCTSLLHQRLQNLLLGSPSPSSSFPAKRVVVGAVAASEAGGFVFASALAERIGLGGVPLLLARSGGKLPPPTVAVDRDPSHISAGGPLLLERRKKEGGGAAALGGEYVLEMNWPPAWAETDKWEALLAGESEGEGEGNVGSASKLVVVVVDDVLASGKTLCAMLRLLDKAGITADRIRVLVVAEFPVHRGRERLRRCGFGGVQVQSLLVFGGA